MRQLIVRQRTASLILIYFRVHCAKQNTTTNEWLLGLGHQNSEAKKKKNKHIFFDSVNWIVILNTTLKFPLNLLNIGGFHRIGEKTLIYVTTLTIAHREKERKKNTEFEWSGRTLLNSEIITHRIKKNVTLIWMVIFNSKKCKSIAYQMCENNVSILLLNSFPFF